MTTKMKMSLLTLTVAVALTVPMLVKLVGFLTTLNALS